MAKDKLVVGNWKMYVGTVEEAKRIVLKIRRTALQLEHTETVVCPPYVLIPFCVSRKGNKTVLIGSQTVSFEKEGSHTGEVGASMLRDVGVTYVLAGHSEERSAGDTDQIVSKRILAVLDAGLKPIVCVGENERDPGGSYLEVLKNQIKNSLHGIPKEQARNIVIAYEPIWAIGAKGAMEPTNIHETMLFVKKTFSDLFGHGPAMKVKVLYGGAVNHRNALDIITIGKADGLLVGRESVNMAGFP